MPAKSGRNQLTQTDLGIQALTAFQKPTAWEVIGREREQWREARVMLSA